MVVGLTILKTTLTCCRVPTIKSGHRIINNNKNQYVKTYNVPRFLRAVDSLSNKNYRRDATGRGNVAAAVTNYSDTNSNAVQLYSKM